MRPRRLARLSMQGLLYWTGAGYVLSRLCPAGAVILMYHSVADSVQAKEIDPRNRISPIEFTRQMEFLARNRRVISVSELATKLEQDQPLSQGSVVLTFDDGYRDNLEVAAPILARLGLPAIIYLPTASISSGKMPWADQLYRMFCTRQKHSLSAMNGRSQHFDLGSMDGCREAFAHCSALLLAADATERDAFLAATREQLDPRYDANTRPLDWDRVRRMRTDFPLIDFGMHSDSHIDLTGHGLEVAEDEVRKCQATCLAELGAPAEHFAYPYNRHSEAVCRIVARHGFRTAVSTNEDCRIHAGSNRMALPRFGTPKSQTLFRLWTQGATLSLQLANRS